MTKSSITATSLSGKKTLEPAEQTPLVFEMISSGKTVRMLDACQYSSSDTAVASVNEEGVVTGIKEGTATITAKSTSGYQCIYDCYCGKAGCCFREKQEHRKGV